MKRLFFSVFFLVLGAALGGGGLYLALNWKQLPFFRDQREVAAKSLLAKFRSACAADADLRGAFVKSAEIKDDTLTLRGFAANKEQVARLQAMGQTLLDDNPNLKTQCKNGMSFDGLELVAFLGQLGLWQREFEEFKGAEKDTPENALKREVMRTTRLDHLEFDEDGKLIVKGVCVKGNKKIDATGAVLDGLLKARIGAAGVKPELMPDMEMRILYLPNPATALQHKLALVAQAKGTHVVSAHYDGKGKLHLQAIVTHEEQRKFIDEAMDELLKDPKTIAMVVSPDAKEASLDYMLRAIIFDGPTSSRELQKKLIEHARKQNKPHLRQVHLANVVPAAVLDDKKEPVADEEGNFTYVYRVAGRMLASAKERKQIEADLTDWLADELPQVSNPNQTPIAPQLEVDVRQSPVALLQERAVQRGLDGAAFTEAIYDGEGKLEILGRLHEPGDEAVKTLESAVKDLLEGEGPVSIAMKPHEASKGGQAIAWPDVLRETRVNLAADKGLGNRVRLDRLSFTYANGQMVLASEGGFLADAPTEHPGAAVANSIDAAIVSRGKANIGITNLKAIRNPCADLQELVSQRADLDGVLVRAARYDAEGRLQIDGYLGRNEHKAALAPLLGDRLAKPPELLKKGEGAWSLESMALHPSGKGVWQWPDVLRVWQSEMAASPELPLQRTFLERTYFQYGTTGRPALRCKTIHLVKPKEKLDVPALTKKLDALARRLLPDVAFEQTSLDTHQADTPIYELQKLATENRFDGMLFAEAYYDHEGKLKFDGIRGGDTKDVKKMIEQHLAKDKKSLAPVGLADLDKMKLSPWQAMLDDTRSDMARDLQPFFKQTRIDRAYFELDHFGNKTRIRFEGICIHQGKMPASEQSPKVLTELLTKQLQAKGIAGYELAVDTIEKKANPALDLQKKAVELGMDGVVFNEIGFDAKGACYVKLPLVPKGQEANIRKLLEDAAKTHPHLRAIQQR